MSSQPADAPPVLAGTVAHWNIAGWARHRGDTGISTTLADWVRSQPELPLSLTVNEICSGQFDVLGSSLAEAGFSSAAAWSIPDFGEPGCASYGNAVFWRGGDGGVERLTYPDEAQIDGPATREKRTLVRAVSATLPFAVATTHPAPHTDLAARQVAIAAEWLAARTDPPTVLCADLNLPPSNSGLDVLYAGYQEADRWPRRLARPTHTSLRKLDYVFAAQPRMRIATPIGIAFRLHLSDHARITAGVEVRTTPDGPARPGQRS